VTQDIELWSMDEDRLEVQTIRRRRSTARGIQPVGPYQHASSTVYVYGTVAPRTGDAWFFGGPTCSAAHVHVFSDGFAAANPHTPNILLVDTRRSIQRRHFGF
jgi:hypothetical protein